MTSPQPVVSQIVIYPIKSLDGVSVDHRSVLDQGGLAGDREFAIVDEGGAVVNGKRTAAIHRLRAQFNLDARSVSLSVQGEDGAETFHLDGDRSALERWLSDYFQMPVRLIQDCKTGFPDDLASPGPTLVSTATLEAITAWYPGLSVEKVRLRFRSNLEIANVPGFWEDRLFTDTDEGVAFQVGDVRLIGVNPCQRCVVVTRNPETGEPLANFQKTFVANRKEAFPAWAARSRFNHFFRLAINTRSSIAEAGKTISVGDPIFLL